MIAVHFAEIRGCISEFGHIVVSSSVSEKLNSEQKDYISGTIIFTDSSILEFTEVKSMSNEGKEKYSCH